MLRSRRATALILVAVVLLAALGATLVLEGDDPASDRPNILVVMTDDQTLESMRVMPRVKALIADQGVTFTDSIVSFSLCCPSRATFLTGQYSHNHGVRGNQPPNGGYEVFDDEDTTLPAALQAAGYTTAHVGKYLNGYGFDDPVSAPPGWDEWFTELDVRSQRYRGFTMLENGEVRTYGQDDYSTDVFTDRAVDVLERHADSEDPLFLAVDYFAPHADLAFTEDALTPATPADRHLGRFEDEPLPDDPSFDEVDVSDKPESIRSRPRVGPRTEAAIRFNYARYLESLLAVDEGVDRLITVLEQTGQLDDTVVIFTSDNGYFFGEHRITRGKERFYEPSIAVPLYVRGPGIPAGEERRSLVANIDLAPTILDLAGATAKRPADGRSLVPMLRDGEEGPEDRAVLLESAMGGPNDLVPDYGVRTGRYAYFELQTGERELYDLEQDPHQLDNRAGDPDLADVEARLAAEVARLKGCAGQSCR